MPYLSTEATNVLSTLAAPILAAAIVAFFVGLSYYDEWSWNREGSRNAPPPKR